MINTACRKREEIITNYFQCWTANNGSKIDSLFAKNIVYTESHGPQYRGINHLRQWFFDWNQKGKVLKWDVKQFIHYDDRAVVEWYFECLYEGSRDGFDGVSLVTFDAAEKITLVKEFQAKAHHHCPYE